jgi:hypothetical protein
LVHEPADDDDSSDEVAEQASGQAALLDELLAEPPAPAREPAGLRTRMGRMVEWTSGQAPKVEFEGNDRGPLPARSIVPLDPTIIAEAIQTERGVLLTFEDGRPDAPIITGLLQDFVGEAPQLYEEDETAQPESNIAEAEARIDGRRIELEAADEIVLRCGQASITLRRNGRVVIRGTYVESRSRGVNRIKGGSVEIN